MSKWVVDRIGKVQVWYPAEFVNEIKNIAAKALNLVDYKTYFKRNNVSVKQEGFKALQQIKDLIESEDKNDI